MLLSTIALERIILDDLPIKYLPVSIQNRINSIDAVTAFLYYRSKPLISHYLHNKSIRKILFDVIDNKSLNLDDLERLFKWLRGNNIKINIDLLYEINLKLSEDTELLVWICENGQLELLKYLYETKRISTDDFRAYEDNILLVLICYGGHLNMLKFVHEKMGLDADDFRNYNNSALRTACKYGHLRIVKYLHGKIGLNITDFSADRNKASNLAFVNGHQNIVRYINRISRI